MLEPINTSQASNTAQQRKKQALQALKQSTNKRERYKAAFALISIAPRSKQALSELIYHEAINPKRAQHLRNYLDLAHELEARNRGTAAALIRSARQRTSDEETTQFDAQINHYFQERTLFSNRSAENIKASKALNQRQQINNHSCDVICSASSNEAPYITDFIHHHIFQGFSNIFIGINNDETRITTRIVNRISRRYPQVHAVSTNQAWQIGQQRESNARIYQYASRHTTSSHCMIVDADESWIAKPFTIKIKAFLACHASADVISSNWIQCCGGDLFDHPINLANAQAYLGKGHKSIFRYGLPITELGGHVPWIDSRSDVRQINSDGSVLDHEIWNGERRLPKTSQNRSVGKKIQVLHENRGWIIHRLIRSELEYANTLIYPQGQQQRSNPFKDNRGGFLVREEQPLATKLIHALFGATRQPEHTYSDSRNHFIDACGVEDLIGKARKRISERRINQRINAIPSDVIQAHSGIWKRSFRGTRFLHRLNKRSRISATLPSSDATA